MFRRLVTLLAALALLASVGGCAALSEGADGIEAAAILERATKAQESVESMSFAMTMRGEAAGETFSMQLDGGGYVKGDREGDMVMRMSTAGAGMPAMQVQMVALEGRAFTNMGGSWQELPGGLGEVGGAAQAQLEQQLEGLDLTRYVTDVDGREGDDLPRRAGHEDRRDDRDRGPDDRALRPARLRDGKPRRPVGSGSAASAGRASRTCARPSTSRT